MPIDKDQAEMLATLAVAARPHGAPRWDPPGVLAALAKVRHLALPDVMRAVANAAEDRDLKTPGAIANPTAPCWRTKTTEPTWVPATIPREHRCSTCSKPRERCTTNRIAGDDHPFTPDIRRDTGTNTTATVEALKAEIQPMRQPQPEETNQ